MSRVFANGPGVKVSIRRRIIPKTQKMLLDAVLLNKREPSGHPLLRSPTLLTCTIRSFLNMSEP